MSIFKQSFPKWVREQLEVRQDLQATGTNGNSKSQAALTWNQNKQCVIRATSLVDYKSNVNYFRQLGLIAFKREAIINFISLNPTKLEIIESVDMNRFLENDITINMIETNLSVDGVDTPQDLIRVEKKMRKDELYKLYKSKI